MFSHSFLRAALCACALTLAGTLASRAGLKDGHLDLYWIDSEGGGSTLIVTPAGESILIDAGNPGGRDPARIHKVVSTVANLRQIDHLIVTHLHLDHFGGAPELSALVPIRNVWDHGVLEADPDGNKTSTWPLTGKAYREIRTGARQVVKPGTILPLKKGANGLPIELRCYISRQEPWNPPVVRQPPAGATEPKLKAPDTSDNANSSAWVLSLGRFRFFDAGDLTWNVETKLVWPRILVPEVDLLQVTHHGLDVSNHPRLLQALNPTVSVMNNGPTKGGMGEVMANLRALPLLKAQYQVHRNVRPDGATNNCPDSCIANQSMDCKGEYIHCSVSPDGNSYRLVIPSRNLHATYQTRKKSDQPAAEPRKAE